MATLKNTIINDTGYLHLPNGSTAQRPGSPVAGHTRWNTTEETAEVYNGSEWKSLGEDSSSTVPFITNGLQQYLDAGLTTSYSGAGNTWVDLSGNGRNVTWTSTPSHVSGDAGYFATNGKIATGPASNSFGINNTSGYTIILVFQTNSFSNNGAFKFSGTVNSYNRGIFLHPGWTIGTLYFDQGGCCDAGQRITYSTISTNTWYMVGLRSTVATRSILLNGSGVVSNTTSAATDINLTSTAQMVGNVSDEAYSWDGDLAIFATYNRGLSDAEFTENYNAIKTRFGI